MRSILKYLLVLVSTVSFGQYNLVPNPSFEVFDTCPSYQNQGKIYWATPWNVPLHFSTPDYMNACDTSPSHTFNVPYNIRGFEYANTGGAYVFIQTVTFTSNLQVRNYREYIQAPLIDSLIGGLDYCIKFYVSASDSSNYISNNIGIYFSPVEINDTCAPIPCNLPYIPQFENDTANNLNSRNGWTEVSGTYTALGGEKYIVIGNFRDSSNTVSIYTGWSFQTQYGGYYIDDVLITPCDSITGINEQQNNPSFTLSPNPVSTTLTFTPQSKTSFTFSVYNYTGLKVMEVKNQTSINVAALPRGLYIAEVRPDSYREREKVMRQKFVKESP